MHSGQGLLVGSTAVQDASLPKFSKDITTKLAKMGVQTVFNDRVDAAPGGGFAKQTQNGVKVRPDNVYSPLAPTSSG